VRGAETCDDGGNDPDDGCTATCVLVPGWVCPQPGWPCVPDCGDAQRVGGELCDDGNTAAGDGCSEQCQPEPGWLCPDEVAGPCMPECGDGRIVGPETCDDGAAEPGDGCSSGCVVEPYSACSGEPSECQCVVYVDARAVPGHRDGATWGRALQDPRDGLDASAVGCEVWVAQGHYVIDAAAGPLRVPAGVGLCGGFAGGEGSRTERDIHAHPTVLDGLEPLTNERVERVIELQRVDDVRLDGLVLTNGAARHDGGGARVDECQALTISGCRFVNNHAGRYGGGLWTRASQVAIRLSSFERNQAEEGGGASFDEGSEISVGRTSFVGNTASVRGGGVRLYRGTALSGRDLLLAANSAEQRWGGGILSWDRTRLILVGVTVADNRASRGAGGIRAYNAELTRLANCVVWGNEPGAFEDVGVPVEATYCDLQEPVLPGEGNLSQDPGFVAPGDYHLGDGSPCIDVGSDADASLADLEQRLRVDVPGVGTPGVEVDLGAYEYQLPD